MNDQRFNPQSVGLLAEGVPFPGGASAADDPRSDGPGACLFTRCPDNPILTKEALPYPCSGIFNPAAVSLEGETILLARVEDMRGISHLALCRSKDGVTDWSVDPVPAFEPDPGEVP